MSSSDHRVITVEKENRKFDVSILKYDNGFFISITEGARKLGATIISAALGPAPASAEIIPAKTNSLFLKLLSQNLASQVHGVCIVSLYTKEELDKETSKILIEKIVEAAGN